jgi:peptidoglycan lytic transglycosylase G
MKDQHLESSIFGDPSDGGASSTPAGPDGWDEPGAATRPGAVPGQQEPGHQGAGGPGGAGSTGRPGAGPRGPRSAQERRRRRRRRRSRRLLVLLLTVALVGGAGVVAVQVLKPMVAGLTESKDWTGTGTGRATVVVHAGDSGRTIGVALQEAGVVKTSKAFADVAADNPQAGSIQPGSYALRKQMSARAALDMLLDPANRTVPTVVVREGLWKSEVIKALSNGTGRPLAEYQAALKNPGALGLPAAARGNVEGYLFPATYEFEADAGATTQLRTMVAKTLAQLRAAGVAPASAQRVLTVASIVEAEARRDADRGKVARVVNNRLAKKMKLQMDSTVHYVVQRRGGVATSDAERATKSPYNTYYAKGLPPGPIGNPGRASITAAAKPTPGPWLYFVAVNPDTGETRFAADPVAHRANEKLFIAWCSAHKNRC